MARDYPLNYLKSPIKVRAFVYSEVFFTLTEVFLNLTAVFLTLTEVFPCFFLSGKANGRVKLAKTGHGPYSSTLVVICLVRLLFVLFYVLFVCKCVLPPGDNPIAINKYIITSLYVYALLYKQHIITIYILSVKGKAIQLQAWTGPGGFRRLRLQDFKTFGT